MAVAPFTIRDFHKSDLEALWGIDQRCFAPGISYSRLELAAFVRLPGAFTLVAEIDGRNGAGSREGSVPHPSTYQSAVEVVGFVVANASHGAGHIITIDVLPKAQRWGIGSGLLRAAEERLNEKRCAFVRLETAVDNRAALSFYKRHQYFVVRTLPRYYPDGADAFVLRKELQSGQPDE